MDARAARVHAALQLQHSLEALRADFDAHFGDLAEKRTTNSDAPSQLWAYVARKHSHGAVRRLRLGDDPNAAHRGAPCIVVAAAGSDATIVKELLDHGN